MVMSVVGTGSGGAIRGRFSALFDADGALHLATEQTQDVQARRWDVSVPTAPILLDEATFEGTPNGRSIIVHKRWAYSARATSSDLRAFDVTSAASIVSGDSSGSLGTTVTDCAMLDGSDYLVVVTPGTNRLRVYDVSAPGSFAALVANVVLAAGMRPDKVRCDTRYAYILNVNGTTQRLVVYDLVNPAAPVQVAAGIATTNSGTTGWGMALSNSGDVVALFQSPAASAPNNFYLVDISTPTAPSLLSTSAMPVHNAAVTRGEGAFTDDDQSLIVPVHGVGAGLSEWRRFDVSALASPTLVETLTDARLGNEQIVIAGDYAYAGRFDAPGVVVVGGLTPPAPWTVGLVP